MNFEKTIIFLTSNLGAREMSRELRPEFGFESALARQQSVESGDKAGAHRQERRCAKTFRRNSSTGSTPVVTYQPLDSGALMAILDQQSRICRSTSSGGLGSSAFHLEVPARSRKFLLEKGTSPEYGARELKRILHHQLMQPLAALVVGGQDQSGRDRASGVGAGAKRSSFYER